jgi:uncharacterized protein
VTPDGACLRALVFGGAVLGGGGGGSLAAGLTAVREALAAGAPRIVALDRIAPEATLATLSAVGTVSTTSGATLTHWHFDRALALFEPFANRAIAGFIASEVGPRAVTYGLRESAITGVPVVDAPCNGRAHPLFAMGSLGLHRWPQVFSPAVAVGGTPGSSRYVELAVRANVTMAGRIVRQRAEESGVALAVVRNPVSAAYARHHAAVGGLGYALRVGQMLLARLPEGCEVVLAALAKLMGGRVLASGRIASARLADRQGFTVGRITVERADGRWLGLSVCNELMAVHAGKQALATFPDLITLFDRRSGLPLETGKMVTGRRVMVFIVPRQRLILGSPMRDETLLRVTEGSIEPHVVSSDARISNRITHADPTQRQRRTQSATSDGDATWENY